MSLGTALVILVAIAATLMILMTVLGIVAFIRTDRIMKRMQDDMEADMLPPMFPPRTFEEVRRRFPDEYPRE